MKTIRHRSGVLHVETPLGIVNIRVGLSDAQGRAVDAIEVLGNMYAGEPPVVVRGSVNTRLVRLKRPRDPEKDPQGRLRR